MESLMDKIVPIAMSAVLAAAMTGQLPRFTQAVRMAQLQLLRESRPSTWGDPSIFVSTRGHKPRALVEHTKSPHS